MPHSTISASYGRQRSANVTPPYRSKGTPGHATTSGYLDSLESFVAMKKGHPGRVGLMLMHHTRSSVEGSWSAINVELNDQFDTSFDSEDIFAPPRL